jgi:acetyl-CoA acyltransferase
VSDGGSALILCSEEGLKQLGKRPEDCVEVLGLGVAAGSLYTDSDPLELHTTAAAANVAYAESGVSASQIQVGEVHDCFTVTEILMYEALGLAARGEGKQLARDGTTAIDGAVPINTGGGLVGFGHPVGATGKYSFLTSDALLVMLLPLFM